MFQHLKSMTRSTQFKEGAFGFIALVSIVCLTIWLSKYTRSRPPKSLDELGRRVESAGMFVSLKVIISKAKLTDAEAKSVPITSDWKDIVVASSAERRVVGGPNAFAWGAFVLTGDRELIDEITKLPELPAPPVIGRDQLARRRGGCEVNRRHPSTAASFSASHLLPHHVDLLAEKFGVTDKSN
jgi:hypothetical protein